MRIEFYFALLGGFVFIGAVWYIGYKVVAAVERVEAAIKSQSPPPQVPKARSR